MMSSVSFALFMGSRLTSWSSSPVLKRMKIDDPDLYSEYKVGDLVKIISGNFAESEGTIEAIDSEAKEVTVLITFFGRSTEFTAKFSDIEKVDSSHPAEEEYQG